MWSTLRHPNILPFYGFTDDMEPFQPFGGWISPFVSKRVETYIIFFYGAPPHSTTLKRLIGGGSRLQISPAILEVCRTMSIHATVL
jgi:hypothetical protein